MTMVSGWGTAASAFGSPAPPQPAAAGGAATGETMLAMGARTAQPSSESPILQRPAFWIVVLVALAIGLVSFSVRVGK